MSEALAFQKMSMHTVTIEIGTLFLKYGLGGKLTDRQSAGVLSFSSNFLTPLLKDAIYHKVKSPQMNISIR